MPLNPCQAVRVSRFAFRNPHSTLRIPHLLSRLLLTAQNKKAAEAFVRPGGFSKLNFLLNSSVL